MARADAWNAECDEAEVGAGISTKELPARLPQVTVVNALGSSYVCDGRISGTGRAHRRVRRDPGLQYRGAVARQLTALCYSRVVRPPAGKEAWVDALAAGAGES